LRIVRFRSMLRPANPQGAVMSLLSALKILDFTTLLPGPHATMMLADLGADVLRIESPVRPDLTRVTPPFDAHGRGTVHAYLNRSKRSLVLDLKHREAIDIALRLVKERDILVEQFRPGVMERLGLGWETLRAVNPRLVYCSISGYGQTGPFRERAGHDIDYLALSGLLSYSGAADSGPPPLGFQLADVAGGSLHAVIGILAAVVERGRTGKGGHVDVSMTDAAFSMNAIAGAGLLGGGVEPRREALLLNGGSAYGCYRTRDGRHLAVGSLEPEFRRRLCEAIGRSDLCALAISGNERDERAFREQLAAAIAKRTLAEWRDVFARCDACVEPVLELSEAVGHPQIQARGLVVDVPDPRGGTQRQIGTAVKFSHHTPRYAHVGCEPGAHRDETLAAFGYTREEVEALAARGVFGPVRS
jgi:crotonobetainyl-CoA:carnitine CoA-transferase CaiB-like acyl-CoA transferase